MNWRVAKSLEVLRAEADARAPKRSRVSDGTIGDAAHAARPDSDHNPFIKDAHGVGVVRALDITHDPRGGLDANRLAELVRRRGAQGDKRVSYVIWNRRIASAIGGWNWRSYSGQNPHDKHVHISVSKDPREYDSRAPWGFSRSASATTSPRRDKKGRRDEKKKRAPRPDKSRGATFPEEVAERPRRGRAKLPSLVAEFKRLEVENDRAWERLVAHGNRQARVAVQAQSRDIATILLRIETKLGTLLEEERREAEAALALSVPAEATVMSEVSAVTQGSAADKAAAAPEKSAPTISIEDGPGTAVADPTGNGPRPAELRRVRLGDLSDAELVQHIEVLVSKLSRSRAALIKRYVGADRKLGQLAPSPRPPRQRPKSIDGRPPREDRRSPAPVQDKPALKEEGPRRATEATPDEIRALQRSLNGFTDRYLKDIGAILVDGVNGPLTGKRIETAKFYLGYTGAERNSSEVTPEFLRRLAHPRSLRLANSATRGRARKRRRIQRRNARRSAAPHAGVAKFDDEPVASWLLPHLQWARQQGWRGTVISGYRTPEYSEQICLDKCGAPKCPGRCAGRSSNHSGRVNPGGAIDVTEYVQFAELMKRCPHSPRILNAIGASDPNHFSATGR